MNKEANKSKIDELQKEKNRWDLLVEKIFEDPFIKKIIALIRGYQVNVTVIIESFTKWQTGESPLLPNFRISVPTNGILLKLKFELPNLKIFLLSENIRKFFEELDKIGEIIVLEIKEDESDRVVCSLFMNDTTIYNLFNFIKLNYEEFNGIGFWVSPHSEEWQVYLIKKRFYFDKDFVKTHLDLFKSSYFLSIELLEEGISYILSNFE